MGKLSRPLLPPPLTTIGEPKQTQPVTESSHQMKFTSFSIQKCPIALAAGLGGLFTVANVAVAQTGTWTPTSAPNAPWSAIASSADGIELVATGWYRYYYMEGTAYYP